MNDQEKAFYEDDDFISYVSKGMGVIRIKDNVYEIVTDISESSEFFNVIEKLEKDSNVNTMILTNEDKILGRTEYEKYLNTIFTHEEEDEKWRNVELQNRTRRTRQLVILNKFIKKVVKFPKLVVSALRGEIVTPFFGASLASDIRIAADNVKFLLPHTKMNIHPSGALPYFLPKYIGQGKASNILFGKEEISAVEALELGLVSSILADKDFEDLVIEEIYKLTKSSNSAFNCSKVLLNSNYGDLDKYLSFEECDFKQV